MILCCIGMRMRRGAGICGFRSQSHHTQREDHVMEMMKKMFESMMGKMNEKEKERIMEQCLLFMKGQLSGNDGERDGKIKEETVFPPDRSKFAGCCPEMMEKFFKEMRGCFAEKEKGEKEGTDEKTEGAKCCY